MTAYSNLRRNPFTGAYSYRVMDTEIKTIAEFDELPGLYGVQLQDKPKSGSITIVENITGGNTFSEVTTSPLQGQYRVDYVGGYIIFNVLDNGTEVAIDYEGGGTNASKEAIEAMVNNEGRLSALEDAVLATGALVDEMAVAQNDIDAAEADIAINQADISSLDSQINDTGGISDQINVLETQICKFRDGLEVSNNSSDPDHDIDIAAGKCSDSTLTYYLTLASGLTKQLDVSWAPGNAGGMFPGATLAADSMYYVLLIRKDSDGSIDAGADDNASASHIPAGYSAYKCIRHVFSDGSGNIIPTIQVGNMITFDVPQLDISSANPGTSAVIETVKVPPDCVGMFNITATNTDGTVANILFTSPDQTDSVPGVNMHDLRVSGSKVYAETYKLIKVDSSSQIRYRTDYSSANVGTKVFNNGWINKDI